MKTTLKLSDLQFYSDDYNDIWALDKDNHVFVITYYGEVKYLPERNGINPYWGGATLNEAKAAIKVGKERAAKRENT